MREIIRLMTHYPDTFRDFYERLPALHISLCSRVRRRRDGCETQDALQESLVIVLR